MLTLQEIECAWMEMLIFSLLESQLHNFQESQESKDFVYLDQIISLLLRQLVNQKTLHILFEYYLDQTQHD